LNQAKKHYIKERMTAALQGRKNLLENNNQLLRYMAN